MVTPKLLTDIKPGQHLVSVFRDTAIQFPELWTEVYIQGPDSEKKPFIDFFIRCRCSLAESPDKADLVVFAGGSDVNPELYGEKRHPTVDYVATRDDEDIALYEYCYENGIPMLGVCRGAQFGWVMNGGKLYQDIDGHHGAHPMYDPINKRTIQVSSVHHQSCMASPNVRAEILGYSAQSQKRWLTPTCSEQGEIKDIEAYFIRDACFLGIQGHPEYSGYTDFKLWAMNAIMSFIIENPDLELRDRYRRMKKDVMEQRKVPFELTKQDEDLLTVYQQLA